MNYFTLTLAGVAFTVSSMAAAQCDMKDPLCGPAEYKAPKKVVVAQCDMNDKSCYPAKPVATPVKKVA